MIRSRLKNIIVESAKKAGFLELINFSVEAQTNRKFGDYATNIAMILASERRENPKELAKKIIQNITMYDDIEKAESAGAGFINIFLKNDQYFKEIESINNLVDKYGGGEKKNQKIQVEYISANPTGPLHIGNARGGPIGETIARVFEYLGYDVEREFYINDLGGQIDRLGESLYLRSEELNGKTIEMPDELYRGDYINDLAKEIIEDKKDIYHKLKDKKEIVDFFKKEGAEREVLGIKKDCQILGINFDKWVRQSDFEISGKSDAVIEKLKEAGMTEEREGALWFKNSNHPDSLDKESVLRKSDESKTLTYFSDDIAYHKDKFDRGFVKVVDVWGANHHGHILRLKLALSAFKIDTNWLEIVLYQYVRLKEGGKSYKMAKREGSFATLRDVLESGVEADAFKYFILAQNPSTPIEFDIKLAANQSEKNPVYYIKYAHARICSILRKAEEGDGMPKVDLTVLTDKKEIALTRELVRFPEIVDKISEDFQIQTLPHYAYQLASLFHDFYTDCKVLGDDKKISSARLALVRATKIILALSLDLMNIEAPERM